MHPLSTLRRRNPHRIPRAIAVLVSAVAVLFASAQTVEAAPLADPGYRADAADPAVTTLAADLGISILEAQRRIGWQEPASQMADALDAALGERFGGLWIDENAGGRVKVGVVGAAKGEPVIRRILAQWRLTAVTDLVPVSTSYAQLERDSAWLGAQLAAPDAPAGSELSSAMLVDKNKVELRLPAAKALSAGQRTVVAAARARLGERLTTASWSGAVRQTRCAWIGSTDCDAPLRGGVSLYLGPGAGPLQCSTAFNARSRSDGAWYIMTAGHCGGRGTPFSAYQPSTAGYHDIGAVHNAVNAGNDDYSIVRINKPGATGWNVRPWVWVHASSDTTENQSYVIKGTGGNPVGTRVCMSGAKTGTDCGRVVALNIGGAGGYAQAQYCTTFGDSGGAVYSSNLARGINVGLLTSEPLCTAAIYQGITEAANALGVNVATG